MSVKVFVLGLPGSGKSTATNCISAVVRDQGREVSSFNDYDILRGWFEVAPDGPEFSRTECNGFDVHDHTVFDTSLPVLEQQVLQETSSSKEIVTIEFARTDYLHALQQFSASFLQDAYFLFIDTDIPICKGRIQKRSIDHQSSTDNHYVSPYIFETYYNKDRVYYVASDLNAICDRNGKQYNVNAHRMIVVNNPEENSMQAFYAEIKRLTLLIIEQKDIVPFAQEDTAPQAIEAHQI